MSENAPAPQKRTIFSCFRKALDSLKTSGDYLKSIKEVFLVGLSAGALFLTDVPQEVVHQVKNLTASIIKKEVVLKKMQKQAKSSPEVITTEALEGIRRVPSSSTPSRVSENNGVLRIRRAEVVPPQKTETKHERIRVIEQKGENNEPHHPLEKNTPNPVRKNRHLHFREKIDTPKTVSHSPLRRPDRPTPQHVARPAAHHPPR